MINEAKEMIDTEKYSCIVIKENKMLHFVNGKGIKPLLELYIKCGADMKNGSVLDKVIGKAASMIIAKSGVKYVYAYLISETAIEVLEKYDIKYEYTKKVSYIENRDKTDMCPVEKLVSDCNSLEEGIDKIIGFCKTI